MGLRPAAAVGSVQKGRPAAPEAEVVSQRACIVRHTANSQVHMAIAEAYLKDGLQMWSTSRG